MSTHVPDLAVVAGEASGDLLASVVLKGLRQAHPEWVTAGIGGAHMQAQQFHAWWPSEALRPTKFLESATPKFVDDFFSISVFSTRRPALKVFFSFLSS